MKKHRRFIPVLLGVLIVGGMLLFANPTYATSPPPPPNHGQTGNQVPGGGASIAGGLVILTILGLGYGAAKYYTYKIDHSNIE